MINNDEIKIGIIGLGYVGLPLAVEFGKKYPTVGFDINAERINELKLGIDGTLECSEEELKSSVYVSYTDNINTLSGCNVYIVTVPTPVDMHKKPDLKPLIKASQAIGGVISRGDIVIYESTVYPGATEEDCVPVIENVSNLKFNEDFYAGYSPERINPGDKQNRLTNILKITSGSTEEVSLFVDGLYSSIIEAGTHRAASIKVAEAAKVIENTQRDVNIALINELYQIFSKMGINTNDVIEAAATKWNFMKLKPGLVGGHCISVDPYYLLHKSSNVGFIPDLMRKAREINDSMPDYLTSEFVKQILKKGLNPLELKVVMLGFTFKENCPDIRNTKVYDFYIALKNLGIEVVVFDSWASSDEVKAAYELNIVQSLETSNFDVGILTVGHSDCLELADTLANEGKFIFDFKGYI
jgi:UDP-N-acetyl-D-glucosamine/UDP-N-acetyl-D-galactosamine dehydrogenase